MRVTAAMDRSAIGLSVVCLLHCLALPVALTMSPALAAYWFADESFHTMLVYVVLPTSIVAIGLGCKRHRTFAVIAWGASGLLALTLAVVLGSALLSEAGEKLLTMVGAVLVVVAHVQNFRLCRRCDCET